MAIAASTMAPALEDFPGYGYPPIPFDVEDLDRYVPDGLHPTVYGDVLGDRFEVIHKLGHGGFATVWLCYDRLEDRWRAVKIVAASHSDSNITPEVSILEHFDGVSDEELEEHHICLPREHFFIVGPNGRHLCIVMPVLGPSLHDFWLEHGDDAELTRGVARQMAEALEFLHGKGVCHGDFRPRNMLFKVSEEIDKLSFDEIMALFPETGRLQVPPIPATGEEPGPHLPRYIYPCSALKPRSELITGDIVVTDFGEAYHVSEAPMSTGIPLGFAAPEVILSSKLLSFGADIWAFGNTICEMRLGNALLPDMDVYDYVNGLEDMLGPLPEPFRAVWVLLGYGAPGLQSAVEIPIDQRVTMTEETAAGYRRMRAEEGGYESYLENAVREGSGFGVMIRPGEVLGENERDDGQGHKWVTRTVPSKEADQLVDLLGKIFRYQPDERLSASEILAHPWMRSEKAVELGTAVEEEEAEQLAAAAGEDEPLLTTTAVADDAGLDTAELAPPAADAEEPVQSPEKDAFEDVPLTGSVLPMAVALPPPAHGHGLVAWLEWALQPFLPRLYADPMLLGHLCLHS